MKHKDLTQFVKLMEGMAENFSAEISENGLDMYFRALKDYNIEQVEHGIISLIKTRKYTKMPTVAEVLEHVQGGSVEDKAQVEATKVLDAIRQHGPYESVVFDDPVTQAVVEHGLGGWQKINEELTVDKEKWFHKDFASFYGSYSRQGYKRYGVLPGIVNHHNEIIGQGQKKQPVMIGDKDKARQVAEAGKQSKEAIGSSGDTRQVQELISSMKSTSVPTRQPVQETEE